MANNNTFYIMRLIYNIRLWLVFCPSLVAIVIYIYTKEMSSRYEVKTSLYTGVVSGYDIESQPQQIAKMDWVTINNEMENLISIMGSRTTLHNVSLRLYAHCMVYGDSEKDNEYISAANFRWMYNHANQDVKDLIDKTSVDSTYKNLLEYENKGSLQTNYVYGLFNWNFPYCSYDALSKILIYRVGNSDVIEAKYICNDRGIAYNTLKLLNDEFIGQYKELRYGQTNTVVSYYIGELDRIKETLEQEEKNLVSYNVENKVINYDEQSKNLAYAKTLFDARYEEALITKRGSADLIAQLEEKIELQVKSIKNNALFMDKLREISVLSPKISASESWGLSSYNEISEVKTQDLKTTMSKLEADLRSLSHEVEAAKYSKDGIATVTYIDLWVTELIRNQKAVSELAELERQKEDFRINYEHMSPIGITLKQKERNISFLEQQYLSISNNLNQARLREKNLQLTSASLKIMTPPTLPLSSIPSKRRLLVIGSFFATFFFVIGFFIVLELIDRTLQNRIRAERVTGISVLGAIPRDKSLHNRSTNEICRNIAFRTIGNNMSRFLNSDVPNVINIIGFNTHDNKEILLDGIRSYMEDKGLKVKIVSEDIFDVTSRKYIFAKNIKDIIAVDDSDVIMVMYNSLSEDMIPPGLLSSAALNIFVFRADNVWDETDQYLSQDLLQKAEEAPVKMILTETRREYVEAFTGLLPPYSFFRRTLYKFMNMGFMAR